MRSREFYSRAERYRRSGKAFATATVVRVQAPTSGKPGDKAIITPDGEVLGWVGGSCVEPVVLSEARAAMEDGQCRLVRLAPSEDERQGLSSFHRMTCFSGGAMEVYIEPNLPQPRMLIFGSSPVARAVGRLADAARFQVTLVSPDGEGGLEGPWTAVRGLDALETPEPAIAHALVATHGTFDDEALRWCLNLGPAYLGLVTSRRRFQAVKEVLEKEGVPAADIARIHAPAGLDLNAKTPEEIAVSILAQIVSERRSARVSSEVEPEEASEPRQEAQHRCCH